MLEKLKRKACQLPFLENGTGRCIRVLGKNYFELTKNAVILDFGVFHLPKQKLTKQKSKSSWFLAPAARATIDMDFGLEAGAFKMQLCSELGKKRGKDIPRLYMSATHVTNELFLKTLTDENISEYLVKKYFSFRSGKAFSNYEADAKAYPQRPVTHVLLMHMVMFCNILSKQQGLEPSYAIKKFDVGMLTSTLRGINFSLKKKANGFRLPTLEEWKYAAKAGTKNQWSGTDKEDELVDYGWTALDSVDSVQPVGLKRPNGWGFYDMVGNVWDMCHSATDDPTWIGYAGGCYNSSPEECKIDNTSYSSYLDNLDGGGLRGFRLVRSYDIP